MKKILVFDKKLPLKNTGGPGGYLWNLHTYLTQNRTEVNSTIQFYSDVIGGKDNGLAVFFDKVIKFILAKFRLINLAKFYSIFYSSGSLNQEEIDRITTYDFVHIHDLTSMRAYGEKIKRNGTKIIYTTHTPELMVDEAIGGSVTLSAIFRTFNFLRRVYAKKELKAYELADYIMFPVRGVEDCYIRDFSFMRTFFDNAQNIIYTPTAILDSQLSLNENILGKHNIPKSSKIICYVGRHNEVKGYYYLKEIATILLSKRSDIYFIIGGSIGSAEPLLNKNWIELGWVNTQQLLSEVDCFILPNQQTYFDIIALEVLRSGVPLVTTRTGGNKYFESLEDNAVQYIPTSDANAAAVLLEKIVSDNIKEKGQKCREMYRKYFTFDSYVRKYLDNINSL